MSEAPSNTAFRYGNSRFPRDFNPMLEADRGSADGEEVPDAEWPVGSDVQSVLFRELESLEWRIGRLEQSAIMRLLRWLGNRASRLYRRLGCLLLRTPFAGLCQRLMGNIAPEEKYKRWFIQHRATDTHRYSEATSLVGGDQAVLISVLMPVYEPNLAWLRSAVDSVRHQTYPNWELCVVLDGAADEEVTAYLSLVAGEDPRIRPIQGDRGGISSTLNLGFDHCFGEYCAFIDQDDYLEDTALANVADVIRRSHAEVIYTDEDYVDVRGGGVLPIFKPAWSPALLLSCMYMGHLLVVKTDAAKAIGGFRPAHDGAQDYDLVLRMTDGGAGVAHVPRVLYHWRQHEGSTAKSHQAKPYSHLAGATALAETVSRRRLEARVEDGPAPNQYRIRSSQETDTATIIVPTRNPYLLKRLLASIHARKNDLQYELRVILHRQGNEVDGEIAAIAGKFSASVISYSGPFNFSQMNNLGASGIASSLLVFLNDDIVVTSDHWLDSLCSPFLRPEVGIAGSKLLYPDGTIQHCGVVLGLADGTGHAGRFQLGSPFWPWVNATRNVSAVTGACLAVRRELYARLAGFDPSFANNYNDVDLCLRAQRAGFEVVLNCDSPLHHEEARTRRSGTNLRERVLFWTKWGPVLGQGDPFYSPNLTRHIEAMELSQELSQESSHQLMPGEAAQEHSSRRDSDHATRLSG